MAAAVVDININEGETFIMTLEFWVDEDNTIPIDITADVFTGAFQIGSTYIPMTLTIMEPAVNVVEAQVAYELMTNLSSKGKYDIEQLTTNGDKFRVIQGIVRISSEVTI